MGDGGTTGEQTLNTGTHNVGETAGMGTDLANYQKSIELQGATTAPAPSSLNRQRQRRTAGRHRDGRLRHRVHDHQHA